MGAGLSIVAGGACSHGRGVRGCWFVVRGHGGDVSSVVWSSLTRLEGMRVGVLTIDDSIRNNDIVVVRRLVAMSLLATWHLQIVLSGHWLAKADGEKPLSSIKT